MRITVGNRMRTIPVRAAEPVEEQLLADVSMTFEACHTLADLMQWCGQQSPRVHVSEIVTQDEYTHDVVLPYGSVFLSFDTT